MGLAQLLTSLFIGDLKTLKEDAEKAEGVILKHVHIRLFLSVIEAAEELMSKGLNTDEAVRLAHAGLCHTLGFFEETILEKNPKAFCKDGNLADFWKNLEEARRMNIQLGSKHFRHHQFALSNGEHAACSNNHFVQLSKKD